MTAAAPVGGTRYLLDTHTFLWMATEPERLGSAARGAIDSRSAELHLSVASIWEMAIKASLGKLELASGNVGQFVAEQVEATRSRVLDVRAEHAVRVEALPWHHRDPFDRLLVAQALFEKLPILGRDSTLDDYGVERIW